MAESSSLPFVPRKVARAARTTKEPARASGSTNTTVGTNTKSGTPNATKSKDSDVDHDSANAKGKQKALADEDCATLVELALSDYALWADPDLRMAVETSEEGFVPLSTLLPASTRAACLGQVPGEAALAKAVRQLAGERLEVRMVVREPVRGAWYGRRVSGGGAGAGGGYEVRRRDWAALKGRQGPTKEGWDACAVYVENIPAGHRVLPATARFVSALLAANAGAVQHVALPDATRSAGANAKGRGFALVTLSSAELAQALVRAWPWAAGGEGRETRGAEQKDARRHGLRCLPKKRWEALHEEYAAYRARLLARAGPPLGGEDRRYDTDQERERSVPPSKAAPVRPPSPQPACDYPEGCLVFVRGVDPGTNKTALRALFAAAVGEDGIDYVDFQKGMDMCYLRLKTPAHAAALVDRFSEGGVGVKAEMVEGTREAVYWGKVPEKVRREAVARAGGVTDEGQEQEGEGRKRKRRRRK